MPDGVKVEIKPAKGRPMLTWVGKQPLSRVTAFPAQMVETLIPAGNPPAACGLDWSDWPASYPQGGLLFHGDNKEVMAHLLANGFRQSCPIDFPRRISLLGDHHIALVARYDPGISPQALHEINPHP